MSIPAWHEIRQLINSWAAEAGQDCMLCGAGGAPVCRRCERRLPRIDTACRQCAVPLPQPGLCGACLRAAPAFEATTACYAYAFPVDRLLGRFKFGADFAAGRWLARRLADRVAGLPRPDLLVAPPATPARLRERGFNQAVLLGQAVGTQLGVPFALTALRRRGDAPPQRALGARERRRNLEGAFACAVGLEGRAVAIVDDVVTTGSTAHAVAHALRSAGAASVCVWCAARTPPPAP